MIILAEAKNYPSSEPTVVYLICFRGVDPQGGKIIQFSEKQKR